MKPSPIAAALLATLAVILGAAAAHAAGPFGVGLPEPAPSGGGLFPSLFREIAAWQSAFYRDLTATVRAMKTDGTAGLWLATVSFAYGVVHAAGPGHGKAIVSAYVLANRETARNGALLALVSALAQGVTAVALVGVAALLLGATSIAMTEAARLFEIGSFALVAALGGWLVWRKILRPLGLAYADRFRPITVMVAAGPMPALAGHGHGAHAHHHDHGHAHDHRHDHAHGDDHGHGRQGHAHHHDHAGHAHGHGHDHHPHDHGHGHHHHHHGDGLACDCGHVHAPAPSAVAGRLDWRKAWSTVVAVGLRPCTGALIVLVFALSQGLLWAGVAATFAMALGTGLTVAALTLMAVGMRGLAVRISGGGDSALAHRLHAGIEALGALAVLAFGLVMLGASLAA